MTEFLPAELESLEQALNDGLRSASSAALRERVLGDVAQQLTREHARRRAGALVAAALALASTGLVLSTPGASLPAVRVAERVLIDPALAECLQLDSRELRRQALLSVGASYLLPIAPVRGSTPFTFED